LPLAWAGMPKTSFRKNSGALVITIGIKGVFGLFLLNLNIHFDFIRYRFVGTSSPILMFLSRDSIAF